MYIVYFLYNINLYKIFYNNRILPAKSLKYIYIILWLKTKSANLIKDLLIFWRSEWDSNPRAVARKLISSQPRYDHFDTAPRYIFY